MTSSMSQVTAISTCNESSYAILEEPPHKEEMETSTRNKLQYFLLWENSLRTPYPPITKAADSAQINPQTTTTTTTSEQE